jgi:hypothetical protein
MKFRTFCTNLNQYICNCDFNFGSGNFKIKKALKFVRKKYNQNFAVLKRRSYCCDSKIRAIYICTHLFTNSTKRIWRFFCSLKRQNRKFIIIRDSQCKCKAFRRVKTQKVFSISKAIVRLLHRWKTCLLKIFLDVEKQVIFQKYIQICFQPKNV